MKYGEGLFNRARDPRAAPLPSQPVAANSPSAGPAAAPGAQRATPAPAADAAHASRDDGAGSKLIVGPNIKLKGVEIHDCDTLVRSEEHTSELQSPVHLVCRLLLEKKKE